MGNKFIQRPCLVVRNVLHSQAGEFLLALRSDTLLWEFPGGKVDDETVADAGRREQKEETGMTLLGEPVCLGYADCMSVKNPGKRFVDLFLYWKEWSGFPRPVEDGHVKVAWFKPEDMPPLDKMMPGTRHFVVKYMPSFVNAEGPEGDEAEFINDDPEPPVA